ncbi:a regulator of G-protein signaling domain-containing protein, partial [Thalassiosira pseudonana CCMP1335]
PLPKTKRSTRSSIREVISRSSIAALKTDQRSRETNISWDAGLAILLSSEEGILSFSHHCTREFSSENVRFWCAVNDYRANIVVDTREINDVAIELYASFIAANSDTPVNLSSAQRSEIKVAVESGKTTKCTFDRAQREIFSVMSRDSYPRYLASKL